MSNKKRVWHLTSNRWNSAITEYALSAARSLAEVGVENLFSPKQNSPAEKRARLYDLDIVPFKDFSLTAVNEYRKKCEVFNPDVIIIYGGPESFLTKFTPRKIKIVRFRGSEVNTSLIGSLNQRISHSHVDKIIVPGSPLFADCRKIFGADRVETIILGCSTSEFVPKLSSRKTDRPRLLIFGRFDPVKGHREFMQIFRGMLDVWPESTPLPQLIIAGEPANVAAADLIDAAQKLGLGPDLVVVKTGRFSDVADMMSSVTIGVIPSIGSEYICRVAQEFLLCGTAVVVSGVGSLDDVLYDGSGINYGSCKQSDAITNITQILLKTFQETDDVRLDRSAKAVARFSFSTMGTALIQACGI